VPRLADFKSGIRQIENLRYARRGLAIRGDGRESFSSARTRFRCAIGLNRYVFRNTLRSAMSAVARCGVPMWVSGALCAAPCGVRAESVTLHPVADTTLFETTPHNNLGANTDFIAGTTAGNAGQPYRNRALLRFDIAGQIPAGAAITSATLTLLVVKIPSPPTSSTFDLQRLLVSWGEGNKGGSLGLPATMGEATWTSRFSPLPQWTVPGGKPGTDFLTDTSASKFVSGNGPYTFATTSNLVADVQFWLDNTNSNFGWILISEDEATASTARRFASREAGTNAPTLVIEYTAGQTQAQPPRMSQVSLLGDAVSFQFVVEPQRPYAVEFNSALDTTNWLTLTNIAAQLAPTNITASDPVTASQRFYRVKTP
jgi:hypothetical protein